MSTSQQHDVLPESSIPPGNRPHPGATHEADQDRPDLDAFAARLGMTEETVAAHDPAEAATPAAETDQGPVAKVASAVLHATGEDRERLREHRDEMLRSGRHVLSGALNRAASIVMSLSRTLDRAAESVAPGSVDTGSVNTVSVTDESS